MADDVTAVQGGVETILTPKFISSLQYYVWVFARGAT